MIKTTSLETSKLLKDAGFRQDTELVWVYSVDESTDHISKFENKFSIWTCYEIAAYEPEGEKFSAPTTDELLEELLFNTRILKLNFSYEVSCGDITYHHKIINESLPEALAQMWLWLKKWGLS